MLHSSLPILFLFLHGVSSSIALDSAAIKEPRAPILSGCEATCQYLARQYPTQLLNRTNAEFPTAKLEFWSTIQGAVSPACFFRPSSANQVAVALRTAQSTSCQFATKSGGHYSFAASTVEDGLVIELVNLNEITISNGKKSADVGPGNTWATTYNKLQKSGITIPGGRMFGVGVGGLTVGGGVSWLSNLYGWTCDNVLEYEVVLASGQIVTASVSSHPDLHWALRGGGNNFGVVTKFKFNTFEQDKMWYAKLRYNATANVTANAAFADWGINQSPKDLRNGAVLSWNAQASGSPIGVLILTHTNTFDNNTHPVVTDKFYAAGPGAIEPTNVYHAEIAENLLFPASVMRSSLWTTSFVLDEELLQVVFEIWNEEASPLASISIQQIQIQAITRSQLNLMKRNGGSPHGLAGQQKPIGFVNLWARWQNADDDSAIYRAQQRMEQRINDAAKKRGLYNGYKYPNYASQFQDPFTGFGQTNKNRLRRVAQKYDPKGVFQKLAPGGFKVTKGALDTL